MAGTTKTTMTTTATKMTKATRSAMAAAMGADLKGDAINPSHYKLGGVEAIDAIEAWDLGFRLGNAVKYIARAGRKGSRLEDLKKARWYFDREISKTEGGGQ